MERLLANGNTLCVEALSERSFRLRLRKPHDRESALNRYALIDRLPGYACEDARDGEAVLLRTPCGALRVDPQSGAFELANARGEALLSTASAPVNAHEGFRLDLRMGPAARVYGLGDVTRERIEKRGYETEMWVENVARYVPIPFLTSDAGWGLFLNTTWRHRFDVGKRDPDLLSMSGSGGELDVYLFVGDDYEALLNEYTNLTGKPKLLPMWAYGLVYVCNQQINALGMMEECLHFRREGIPCDVIGLEPGWMSKHYDFSVDKQWDPERFYIPYWTPKGDQTFFGALDRLGFKLSLWLCCDYDLSFEEEKGSRVNRVGRTDGGFEQDDHFIRGRLSMDRITKVDEPWFEHLKKFVDQGARCFKLDGANQIVDHPDRKWGNGMDDEEMHNLYPAIYNKQMNRGFEAYTGLRSMVYSAGGYTGIQRFSATWAGDTGGGPKPLVSMLNHGFSGHSNTSCDMDVFSDAGIHFGFFQTWSQLCNWAYWRQPWFLPPARKEIYRFYARLRYRLLPYLYAAARRASRTGYPVMRAMAMCFPDMPRADELLHQYMLGDALLTAAFVEEIALPEGAWFDAWRDEPVAGAQTIRPNLPAGVGGPLYVREGAIIPCCEPGDYVGERPIEEITLNLYPGEAPSQFELYEDDGVTCAYAAGAYAVTRISCARVPGGVRVTVGERTGHYEGQPTARRYVVDVHGLHGAKAVRVDGTDAAFETARDGWCGFSAQGFLRFRMDGAGCADILC